MFNKSIILCLTIVVTFLFVGCDDNGTKSNSENPKPVPGIATDISLTVYPIGNLEPSFDMLMAEEGDFVVDTTPSPTAIYYNVYAEAENYYTEIFNINKRETTYVDLDSIIGPKRTMTGVIFAVQGTLSDSYFANETMTLKSTNKFSMPVTTDEQGRYSIGVLPLGDYTIELSSWGIPIVLDLNNSTAMDYQDLYFLEPGQVDAPNIYLYPETESDISVTLDFPNGGHVSKSEPQYNDGWNVTVTPEGLIDGEYDYLFYKAILPAQPNINEGWLLTTANLEAEFRVLLTEQGFVGREIDDFIEYWIPLLDDAPYYGVFPQDVESFVELTVEPSPKSTLRVFWLVLPFEQPVIIPVPREYDYFIRDGFTVVEWGVFVPHLH